MPDSVFPGYSLLSKRWLRPGAVCAALAAIPSPLLAQRDLKEIPSTDPAVELASFKLAPGLEANLFAQEPLIHKPIQMAWDERGRLWVASSAIYPHIKPGQEQKDQIVILEDTNGDGKADKSTVFYEGLLIPTGILPGDGGAYIANSTELLFMKEGPDGRAGETKVLLSGFGTEDTHHILHGFKRGPDGCLYLMQSVYIHAHLETPFGVRRLMGSGIWQYRPETGRAEIFTMGQINPWGHIFDKWGQSFTTDGAYGEGINYAFPGATYRCLPDQRPRILKGLNPGQPKHCGLEVISGRHFPDDWQGDLITNDFRGHRVNRFKVSDQGSGFASRQVEDVIRSNHGSFRPVDVKMGPDGALYIADWYNPIIQHGEVDFRDERRDHANGRIWRVSVKGREKSPKVDFAKASTEELIKLTSVPEAWVRLEASQEIKRRVKNGSAEDLWQAVSKAAMRPPGGDPFLDLCAAQAVYDVMSNRPNELEPGHSEAHAALLSYTGLLTNKDARVRAWAVRMITQGSSKGVKAKEMGLAMMINQPGTSLVEDSSARVRLEMVNGLRQFGTARCVELACKVLDHPMDENLDFALWLTCSELADTWLPAFQKGEITFGGNIAHIAFALKAADKPEAAGALLTMVNEGKVSGDRVKDVIGLVGTLGGKADLVKLLALAAKPEMQSAVFDALTTAAQQRNLKPDGGAEQIVGILKQDTGDSRIAAAKLAGAWKLEDARGALQHLAESPANLDLGAAALQALSALGGSSGGFFRHLLHERLTYVSRHTGEILAAWARLNPQEASADAAEFLAGGKWKEGSESGMVPAAGRVLDAYLALKNGPSILAAALKDKKIPAAVASAGMQKASVVGGNTKPLIEALTVAGGLQPVVALTPAELTQMMADVKSQGDPARGELIFRRQALLCQNCHAISAVGGIVGPDMVSIGASAPVDYIIESLLEPSKKIKEGYATTLVSTKDGLSYTGTLLREDAREVLLRNPSGLVDSIPASKVAKKENIPISLMPIGLTAMLRRDELVDLVRFLSELGKEGAYKVQEDGTLRRWRTAQPVPDMWRWMNLKGNRGFAEARDELTWLPLYSHVNGTIPGEEAPLIKVGNNEWRAIESEIEVSAAGKVGLRLNDPANLQIFIAGKEVPAASEIQTSVPAGKVRITVLFDTTVRKAPIKVQVFDLPNSPARTKAVSGI
ncbi:MAG TPA: PVC-type heme-binding CxxCH protein [Verrucomicrobiales bacterium]|nr:PVC-type heme-binding CxxCH protein [Verrucomicrobiales bacterium]